MKGDLDIVKAGLIDRIGDVCARLLPDGREEGGQWVSWNPVEHDKGKTPALKVRVRRGDLGAWRDWRSGDKGDVLQLVAYLNRTDIKGALAWGRDFLGIRAMSRADQEAMRRAEKTRQAERRAKDDRSRAFKLVSADRLFRTGPADKDVGPAHCPSGTFALYDGAAAEKHARAYFAARKVPLESIRTLNRHSFRFSPQTEWWKGAVWRQEDGRRWKEERGPLFPAVHSAMRNRMGVVTCCHVTFLDPTRPAKAPVTPAKLMFGEALGSVVEISTGPSGLPFWMADRPDESGVPLIVAEGIETAAAFAANVPEARVWAAGSLAGVGGAPVDLPAVSWVLFARDNKVGNPQAQRQFDQALAGLERHGKRVVVEASHVGDDFNDLARGEE